MPNQRLSENILVTGNEQTTLGGRLYASRQNAGMSLHMVANLLGVKSSTLKSWENDRSEPRVNKLVALAGVLGLAQHIFWPKRAMMEWMCRPQRVVALG